MRYLLLIGVIALSAQLFGQKPNKFFLNEFTISVNHTNVKDDNTENRYGFGIGTYHSFMVERKLNLLVGFEYNRTNQGYEEIHNNYVLLTAGIKMK